MTRVMTTQERNLRQERAVVWDGVQELMTKWDENGHLDAEEKGEYDRRMKEVSRLDKDLERIKQFNRVEDAKEDAADSAGQSRDESDSQIRNSHERAFNRYLRLGLGGLSGDDRRMLTRVGVTGDEIRAQADANAITTDGSGTSGGGYLVPQGFWQNLQIALKQYGGLLNVAKVITTSTGNPMPWPTTDPTNIIGHFVGAQGTQLGFQDFVFGEGMMNAYTVTSNVALASLEAMNDSAFDVEEFVRDRIGESIGRFVAQQLQTGAASSTFPMLGIQTALVAKGTTTGPLGGLYQPAASLTVNTLAGFGSSAQAQLANGLVSFNDIQAMAAKVDPAYRASGRCTWVMDDHTLWKIRSITDGFGRPLWQPNVQVGGTDAIYGYPYLIDQNIGDVSTTASTAGGLMFGDFQTAMVVRQVNQAGVMRLDERYADYLQVGFLGFFRMDSRSNDLRAAVLYESPSA